MRNGWAVVVVAACAAWPALSRAASAQEPAAPAAAQDGADSLADAIATIAGEYAAAQQAFYDKLEGIEDEAERSRLYQESYPKVGAYVARVQSALAGHESEPAAAAGFAWIAQTAEDDAAQKSARDTLFAHHAGSTELAEVVRSLAWGWQPGEEEFLERVSRESPAREVQAAALFSLAQRKTRESMTEPPDLPAKATRAEQLLGRVRDEFGDVKSGKRTLAERVEPFLYELQHLRIGMTAPEIEGTDVGGATMKLSDYRGKVVILDFWGFW